MGPFFSVDSLRGFSSSITESRAGVIGTRFGVILEDGFSGSGLYPNTGNLTSLGADTLLTVNPLKAARGGGLEVFTGGSVSSAKEGPGRRLDNFENWLVGCIVVTAGMVVTVGGIGGLWDAGEIRFEVGTDPKKGLLSSFTLLYELAGKAGTGDGSGKEEAPNKFGEGGAFK